MLPAARTEAVREGRDAPTAVGQATPLRRRIFELVLCEPFEDAIASLGMVMVTLLLAETHDPLEVFDGLAVRLRETLIDAKRRDEADRCIH